MKENLSPKVKALYGAVLELIEENVDVRNVKVSDITGRAGIGKGTAYEYFSNKEELISSALLYHMDQICGQMMSDISGMEDFSESIHYILMCMDREISKRDCLIQFIQLLTDNGPISKLLHDKIKNNSEICIPQKLTEQVLQIGIRRGDIDGQLPLPYMRIAVMSKILMYAFYMTMEEDAAGFDRQQMHRLLCEGMLRELGRTDAKNM